jgi:hypothetical protein
MRALLLCLVLVITGCTNWRTVANQTLSGAAVLARDAAAFEKKYCGSPMKVVKGCVARRDSSCKAFKVCERFTQSLMTFNATVLSAQHALIETDAKKSKVQMLVSLALKMYEPVKATIEGWAK